MIKTILQPLCFKEINRREQEELTQQLDRLKVLYGEQAEFLEPVLVGGEIPEKAHGVLFPQMIGAVFGHGEEIARIKLPVILMTSEFGTVEMWDWEIAAYLRENLHMENVFTPYNTQMAKVILRAISSKQTMKEGGSFLIFQDSPGEGMQSEIFKRFFWWEKECIQSIRENFGVKVIFQSWREVNEKAKLIDRDAAKELLEERAGFCCTASEEAAIRAVKLYMAIRDIVNCKENVLGVGSNCLNESFYADTTPCLAWNWLFEYDHILWACEGDLVSLLSETVLYGALRKPLMMTNLYPFLMGMAALKHEKIEQFPKLPDSDNYALGVHCGYFGFAPQSFCTEWALRPKVLEIVNDEAVAVDCRMACGPVVLAKIHADLKKITVIEAEIEEYVGYPGSDCRNGALIHYKHNSGHKVMECLSSHHAIVIQGEVAPLILQIGRVYGMEVEIL